MAGIMRSPRDFSIEELDMEMIARGAEMDTEERFHFRDLDGTPERNRIMAEVERFYRSVKPVTLNPKLSHLTLWQLSQALILKIREVEDYRALRGEGIRLDMFQITHPRIKQNARAVVSVWMKENLKQLPNGYFSLQHRQYGRSFNLCYNEPYYHQPIAAGRFCTGFLVKDDVIATAAHFADLRNVKKLRFVFGYQMKAADYPVTEVPNQDVYQGVEIIGREYHPMGNRSDWALVRLDRKVTAHQPLNLAYTDIPKGKSVYVLGHPCGLPLKYVPEEPVEQVKQTFFSANLSIYGGNSGSPVFDSETHQVVGMVVRGDQQDFRWTGKGWLSIRYPNSRIKSSAPQCTKVSQFFSHCR